MSSKNSRHGPSSPSSSSPAPHHGSKLPKFLQKQSTRDRSKSVNDGSNHPIVATTPPEPAPPTPSSSKISRKSTKFTPNNGPEIIEGDEEPPTPAIVEPLNIPRPRTRSERPVSMIPDIPHGGYNASTSPSSSTSRIGDLPTRLSGWFSHTFSTSSTDLSLPTLLSQTHISHHSPSSSSGSSSPTKTKLTGASALMSVAKHGKGHLDKAVRYILDSDSTPDKCTDPIWLLGVQHPGYEPPPPSAFRESTGSRRSSLDSSGKRRGSSPSFRSSTSSIISEHSTLSQSQSASSKHPGANWPPVFYADFTSRVWLTYRSQFSSPLKDGRLADLCGPDPNNSTSSSNGSSGNPQNKKWNWSAMVGVGEKEWTNDSGWGCMLRTGQSLLANALVHVHLGREWRRPPYPLYTADYATYVEIITWFLDTPAPEAPFSVHRMALAGKELGTAVGQWFGPSIAAGAIKTLVRAFPDAGLGVSIAVDGQLFQTDVYAASHTGGRRYPLGGKGLHTTWGDRPVLLLLGIRLGLNGVNPIYYDTIKALYMFPQSVGIAGGRPSSSYYFVGSQADNLFYLDPHHARPAIPLRPPPPFSSRDRQGTSSPDSERGERDRRAYKNARSNHQRAPTSPASVRTASTFSNFSYHAPVSPSPLQQQLNTPNENSRASSPGVMLEAEFGGRNDGELLDPVQEHYVTAYSAAELKTFHCDRVRKMPLSGLDPSMLIGFLCRDEADWVDFRRRVNELPRTIFSVQDEPPKWPSDSDDNMGLESMSDPDDLNLDMLDDDDDDGLDADGDLDSRSTSAASTSASTSSTSQRRGRGKSEEVDTEEDPVDPITPGPSSKFEFGDEDGNGKGRDSLTMESEDIEDDWIETPVPSRDNKEQSPSLPPPPHSQSQQPSAPLPVGSIKKGKKPKKQTPVPVPQVKIPAKEHYAFPMIQRSEEDVEIPQGRNKLGVDGGGGGNSTQRMHTARARDGGRTQSGGVRGILTED